MATYHGITCTLLYTWNHLVIFKCLSKNKKLEVIGGWLGKRRYRNIDVSPAFNTLALPLITQIWLRWTLSLGVTFQWPWSTHLTRPIPHFFFFRWNREMELFECREATAPSSTLASGAAHLNLGNWMFCRHGCESRCHLFVEGITLLVQLGYLFSSEKWSLLGKTLWSSVYSSCLSCFRCHK